MHSTAELRGKLASSSVVFRLPSTLEVRVHHHPVNSNFTEAD